MISLPVSFRALVGNFCSNFSVLSSSIGISEYMTHDSDKYQTDHQYFGHLKRNPCDFIVHEIAPDGSIVQLGDPAPLPTDTEKSTTKIDHSSIEIDIKNTLGLPEIKNAIDLSDSDSINQINSWLLQIENESKPSIPYVTIPLVSDASKDARTLIHQTIRKYFPKVESAHFIDPKDPSIQSIRLSSGKSKRKFHSWPYGKNQHLHFVLFKDNTEQRQAISQLARHVHTRDHRFSSSGIKDKRAWTTQRISCFKILSKQIATHSFSSIATGSYSYKPNSLYNGNHQGNNFVITLRGIATKEIQPLTAQDKEILLSRLETVKTQGFINYFGTQRFGVSGTSSHIPGIHLIKSDWEAAIKELLRPDDSFLEDHPKKKMFEQFLKDPSNPELALNCLPKYWVNDTEHKLLSYLSGRPTQGLKSSNKKRGKKKLDAVPPSDVSTDYLGAIFTLPTSHCAFYLHAFQSLIFNMFATKRMQESRKVKVGDLVVESDKDLLQTATEKKPKFEKEADTRGVFWSDLDRQVYDIPTLITTSEQAKKYTLQDVVIPLPGYAVKWPQTQTGNSMYHHMCKMIFGDNWSSSGNSFESDPQLGKIFQNTSQKRFNLPGTYRKLISVPLHISATFKDTRKIAHDQPLLYNDVELLQQGKSNCFNQENHLKHIVRTGDEESSTMTTNSSSLEENEALVVSLSLKTSSYATIVIRELLHTPTNSSLHKKMGKWFTEAINSSNGEEEEEDFDSDDEI